MIYRWMGSRKLTLQKCGSVTHSDESLQNDVNECRNDVEEIINENYICPENFWNYDQTAFQWEIVPENLILPRGGGFKAIETRGLEKQRVTVGLLCNAVGEKAEP